MADLDDLFDRAPDPRGDGTVTVTQLNEYIKAKIDGDGFLSRVSVKGEISNFTNHYKTGHFYFTIKDETSLIRAVMFRGNTAKLRFAPENGMKIVARGRVSAFVRDGQYQLYCDSMEPDGIGALYFAFEQLKKKLAAEGLFDEARKRPLPKIPTRIGVITSPTGAAIRDIINILGRRFPYAKVILYPALVQGAEAAPSLIAGMRHFMEARDVDVIIIGRGGGSAEDLAAFNDETLARAVFASKIPVISAVGHETDFTICDFVADLRAPTPSAAAELAVPDREEMRAALAQLTRRLCGSVQAGLDDRRQMLDALASANVLQNPSAWLSPRRQALRNTVQSLTHSAERRILNEKNELAALSARLDAMSPLKVLSRGYAIVSDENGKVIKRTEDAKPGDVLTARVEDGAITVRVQKTEKREMTDA